ALGQQRTRRAHRARRVAGQSHAHQRELEQFPDVVLVIDDEDVGGTGPVAAVDLGHGCWLAVRMKSAPGVLGAGARVASLASASSRAMYSPRPVPLGWVVKKGSNRCARIASSKPGPSSCTCSTTLACGRASAHRRTAPGAPEAWRTTFDSRLSRIWCR